MLSGVETWMRECCRTIDYYQNQHFFSFNLNPKSKASFFSELIEMAEYTKATTTKLIKFTNRLSKDSSKKFNEQFKVIFKKFITLMKVTSKKLTEAKSRVRIKTSFG